MPPILPGTAKMLSPSSFLLLPIPAAIHTLHLPEPAAHSMHVSYRMLSPAAAVSRHQLQLRCDVAKPVDQCRKVYIF
jgi:hypothetical protein